jgi:hypothetical protein
VQPTNSWAPDKGDDVQFPVLQPSVVLAPGRDLDSAIDFEIPPVTRCAECRRFDCDGCERVLSHALLPWEQHHGHWLRRLWETARRSLSAASESCLDSKTPRPLKALSFAFLVELFASFSLVFGVSLLAIGVVPRAALLVLQQPAGLGVLFGFGSALALFLVVLHVVWGFGLELGLALVGSGFELRRGVTFALYACGWDLFTSPVGFVVAVARSGLKGGLAEMREATRVPRDAVLRYVTMDRGASSAHGNFVTLFSFLLPVGLTLLVAGTVAVVLVMHSLGGLLS